MRSDFPALKCSRSSFVNHSKLFPQFPNHQSELHTTTAITELYLPTMTLKEKYDRQVEIANQKRVEAIAARDDLLEKINNATNANANNDVEVDLREAQDLLEGFNEKIRVYEGRIQDLRNKIEQLKLTRAIQAGNAALVHLRQSDAQLDSDHDFEDISGDEFDP